MRIREVYLCVHFKAIGIRALLLANLTVPSQALKPLALHLVANVFGGSDLGFRHGEN